MAISFDRVYPEKARTAAPDTSTAINLQSVGQDFVTAMLSVVSTAGSTSSTLDVKSQWSGDGTDWEDIPGGAFAQIRAGFTTGNTGTPSHQILKYEVKRKYLRFVPAVTGTHAMTWRLELKYSS